jgi:hypothetical protein
MTGSSCNSRGATSHQAAFEVALAEDRGGANGEDRLCGMRRHADGKQRSQTQGRVREHAREKRKGLGRHSGHRHTDTHTDTHRHTDTHTDTHRHTDTHTDTHRHTDTHTDTQTHRHTHRHTQTHTHTHARTDPLAFEVPLRVDLDDLERGDVMPICHSHAEEQPTTAQVREWVSG